MAHILRAMHRRDTVTTWGIRRSQKKTRTPAETNNENESPNPMVSLLTYIMVTLHNDGYVTHKNKLVCVNPNISPSLKLVNLII